MFRNFPLVISLAGKENIIKIRLLLINISSFFTITILIINIHQSSPAFACSSSDIRTVFSNAQHVFNICSVTEMQFTQTSAQSVHGKHKMEMKLPKSLVNARLLFQISEIKNIYAAEITIRKKKT